MSLSKLTLFWLAVFVAAVANHSIAAVYYVAPTGNDSNSGSEASPFATITKALSVLNNQGGHTIYLRGGTYNYNSRVTFQSNRTGTSANPNNLLAYPGETPILDFATMPSSLAGQSGGRGLQFNAGSDWWVVKGLTIQRARDNGLYNGGSNSVFEQIVTRENQDSGFQLHETAANNLVLNCDSYLNYDPQTLNSSMQPVPGENADGFAVKDPNIGPGNIFRGNRAWANSDDGWDTFDAVGSGVLIQDSWSFDNGFNLWGVGSFAGDGTGYKLGEDGGRHVLSNVLAIDNAGHGIDINQNANGVKVYNSTSFSNNKSNWYFDEDSSATANQHILQNNVSLAGTQSDRFDSGVDDSYNTWNGGVFSADEDDFASLDRVVSLMDLLKQPRNPDGSLPNLGDFLKLATDSNLIDVGTPVAYTFGGITYNLSYNGLAPDLGAFESAPSGPALPGDFNGDNVVDAADYTVWRNHLGEDDESNINHSGDGGDVGPGDYDLWKLHYGNSLVLGGGGLAAPVPEPGASMLAMLAGLCGIAARRTGRAM